MTKALQILFLLLTLLTGCKEERNIGTTYTTPTGNGIPVIINGQYQASASSGDAGQALIWDGGATWGQAGGRAFIGTCASRVSATGSGNLYSCTDFPATYIDDPTLATWRQLIAPLAVAGGASSLGSYTSVGSIGATQQGSAIAAAMYANGSATVGWLLTPSANLGSSSTWIVELTATASGFYLTQYPSIGLSVANGTISGTSTGYSMNVWQNGSGGFTGLHMLQDTIGGARVSSNNEVSTNLAAFFNGMGDGKLHLRILADGTNAHFQIGNDGFYWWDWYTLATPSSLTHYGFQLGNDAATGGNSYIRAIVYKNEQKSLNVSQATVSTTTGNGVSPIVVTTTAAHNFNDGDCVAIHGVGGNTNANTGTGAGQTTVCGSGADLIHVTASNQFQLVGTTGNGAYTSGGIATVVSR